MAVSTQKPGLPNIKGMNASLAADASRVGRFVDGLLGQVDQLIGAAENKDWAEIARVSEYLALGGKAYGYSQVADAAERVASAVKSDAGELEIKRGLMKLIGSCGRAKKPQTGNSSGG